MKREEGTMKCKEQERAWAAGFFDGEGSVGLHVNNKKKRLQVSISQSNGPELLERFARVVGVGKVRGPYGPYSPNQQPYYQYMSYGTEDTIKIFETIGGYLCTEKRNKFENCLTSKISPSGLVDSLRLAWSAGFLDGEGTFGFYAQGDSRGSIKISADQVSPEPLNRLVEALGGQVRGPYTHSPKSAGKQDFYKWDCSIDNEVQQIICSLYPWMGDNKRSQAERSLNSFNNRRPNKKPGPSLKTKCIRGHDLTDPDNLTNHPSGGRSCKICPKIRKIENRKAKNEAL